MMTPNLSLFFLSMSLLLEVRSLGNARTFFFFCFLSFFPILWVLDFPQTDSPMKTITNTPSHFPALAPVDKAVAHT